jgi:hypothetical protein
MRSSPAVLVVLGALVLSGCVGTPQPLDPAAAPAAAGDAAAPQPVTVSWDGHILSSPTGALAHNRDTESLAMPLQKEGFVFEVLAPPQTMQVALHWPGPGTAVIMVSSPHQGGKGLEFFTEPTAEQESCLQVPPADIQPGGWQVMIHTQDSVNADFTFEVTTVGGLARIVEGQPHSSAEAAETEARDALPCEAPPAA